MSEEEKTTIEFGGMSFTGGKAFALLTALSTLGGASWGAFEFYADYMDMKEIVQNIDVDEIKAQNTLVITKLDEAIEYTRDIKSGLRDDIISIEKQADRVEDMVRETEEDVRNMIDKANERFENKRNQLQANYDSQLQRLRDSNDRELKELEQRVTEKLQRALDNPLAN
jgi:Skp family chaperone for outer membrane proteins